MQSLQSLAHSKRYDYIVTLSLYKMMQPTCGGQCRITAALNAIRGSLLLGDTAGAILIATHFLPGGDTQAQDLHGWQNQARLLVTYSYALQGDSGAVQHRIHSLGEADQYRLLRLLSMDAPSVSIEGSDRFAYAQLGGAEKTAWQNYDAIPSKSPWVAGISNLVLPGAGYAYLGMWQTAALNALLTGICIGSAIELFQNRLYMSSAAVGTVGSIFYVGGALGAARSANDLNQKNKKEAAEGLRSLLFPELNFEF